MNATIIERTREDAQVTELDRLFGPLPGPPRSAHDTWTNRRAD